MLFSFVRRSSKINCVFRDTPGKNSCLKISGDLRAPRGDDRSAALARALADLCDAVLAARKAGGLSAQQLHIAERCDILVRGFARIGIISLVDEATGYQEVRDRKALAAILDRYLRKEHAAWAKCFPDDFYKELFRLRGWEWKDMNEGKKPQCVGIMTKDIVYERLAPGILSELGPVFNL